jgi:hypothetical protein
LTAQLLLLLVMLLTLGLGWSVSRLDGAWNDDISSCRIDRVYKNVNAISSIKDLVFKLESRNRGGKISGWVRTRRLCGDAGEVGERSGGWPKGSWLGAGGSRRFRRLTDSRLAQWPHRTATVV